MNNKQQNQNRADLDTSRSTVGGMYQDFINNAKTQYGKDQSDANSLRSTIQDKYTNNNNFMPNGLTLNSSGWFDLPTSSTSGFGNAPGGDFSAAKSGYQSFADTGGVNRGDFSPALDSYKNFMGNGGIGESEADALRTRATAGVPAFYNQYKNALARRSNVQGGYSPGYDSQMAEIGKDSARQGFNASRQVEGDIVDKRQQGREFGTSGFGNLMSDITGKEQSGKLAGLGGLKGIGDSEQQNSQFNSSKNQAMQQFLMDLYSQGGKTNAAGLQGLYSSTPGNVGQSGSQLLAGINGFGNNDLQNLIARISTNKKGVDWSKVASTVGSGVATYGALAAMSDRDLKENIQEVNSSIINKFKSLPISTWNYIGDDEKHLGPMAQDMQEIFGIGDGKTIHLVDVMGLMMLLGKELATKYDS